MRHEDRRSRIQYYGLEHRVTVARSTTTLDSIIDETVRHLRDSPLQYSFVTPVPTTAGQHRYTPKALTALVARNKGKPFESRNGQTFLEFAKLPSGNLSISDMMQPQSLFMYPRSSTIIDGEFYIRLSG